MKKPIQRGQVALLVVHTLCFSRSVTSDSLAAPWTVAHQAPLSVGFPRQEYWSGLPLLLQGTFPAQGSNPRLLRWQADSLPPSHQASPVSGRARIYEA